MVGIIVQWYCVINLTKIGIIAISFLGFSIIAFLLFYKNLFKISNVKSTFLQSIIFILGLLLSFLYNVKNSPNFITTTKATNYTIVAVLNEPLVQKSKSYKANATIKYIVINDTIENKTANVILYFKKDSIAPNLSYGSTIVTNKTIQEIKNTGNPGAFDYAKQSLFKGYTHQLFLSQNDYNILPDKNTNALQSFLYKTQTIVLNIISKYVSGEKEKGIAEALLIGYRDDLDKDLNQAYSNTGTVHVIAISGLHLGFIYLLLVQTFKPLQKITKIKKVIKIVKPITIIAILWLFSLLAGGAASILRSAIMFTCIVIGENINRKSTIYNNLAVSAFIILCIFPYSLWDVGFQLSYAAVVSIVFFMKPIYNLLYIKNKILDWLWQMSAVTISAQILTLPITVFHFHQFPNLFLITNIVAVPLSTIILGVELFLILFGWCTPIAKILGITTKWLVQLMNGYIEWWGNFSFAVSDYLQVSLLYCIIMYAFIIAVAYWLLQKSKAAFFISLCTLLFLIIGFGVQQYNISKQKVMIVYNTPKQTAIDFIQNKNYEFIGDSIVEQNVLLKNFNLKPSRIFWQTNTNKNIVQNLQLPVYSLDTNNILLWNKNYTYKSLQTKIPIAVVVISKNPKLYIDSLLQAFKITQIVADGTNPNWKLKLWQKDCDRLKIPFHNTNIDGAFVKKW